VSSAAACEYWSAFAEADIDARPCDELLAVAILADITNGGQEGRGGGGAEPRQLQEEWAVWAWLT
jgi:hypothetical protein